MSRQRYPEEFKIEAVKQVTEKELPFSPLPIRRPKPFRYYLKRSTR
ncbi:hypothetical protein [Pseudomonas sp. HTZ2]|nr:hypothetical protein [Pseudomonas sp. HTZ2]